LKEFELRLYNRSLINRTNGGRALPGWIADRFRQAAGYSGASTLPELVEFVDEVVDDLGSRSAVEALQNHEEGTSADRQLAAFHRSDGDQEPLSSKSAARH
jgi:hypothetical protein